MTNNSNILDIKLFSTFLRQKGHSANTIKAYKTDIDLFFRFCINSNLNCYTQDAVYRYLSTLGYRKKQASTIERKRASLVEYSLFYRPFNGGKDFFNKKKIRSPKKGQYLPNYYQEQDVFDIMNSIDRGDELGERTHMMITLLFGTGIRANELLNIKPNHINPEKRSITVVGKGLKVREVFMNEEVLGEYMIYYKRFKPLIMSYNHLFFNRNNKPLSYSGLYYILKQIEKKNLLSLRNTKKISAHAFRHSFATSLLNNGADIRKIGELLGHSSLNTTQRYTHLDKDFLKKSLSKYHPHGIA